VKPLGSVNPTIDPVIVVPAIGLTDTEMTILFSPPANGPTLALDKVIAPPLEVEMVEEPNVQGAVVP
jgi:hypothetical protein